MTFYLSFTVYDSGLMERLKVRYSIKENLKARKRIAPPFKIRISDLDKLRELDNFCRAYYLSNDTPWLYKTKYHGLKIEGDHITLIQEMRSW